jgi:dipeptidyl aminopeptidase/acylaminoacyl peptidase
MTPRKSFAFSAIAAFCLSSGPIAAQPIVDSKVYDRAIKFTSPNLKTYVLNADPAVHWRAGGRERLTYLRELGDGRGEFIQIDAATGKRSPALNQAIVAAGLSKALGKTVEATKLPFTDYDELPGAVRVTVGDKIWTCSLRQADCSGVVAVRTDGKEVTSPDGKWVAYTENYNLWVRSTDGTTRFPLTTDGEPHYAYARSTELEIGAGSADGGDHAARDNEGRHVGFVSPTNVLWSPDSKKILTHKLDERRVREMAIVQSTPTDGSLRPVATVWRMAMPNDPDVAMTEPWIFDLESRSASRIALQPIPTDYFTPILARDVWWSTDGRHIFAIVRARYKKSMTLYDIDPATGATHPLISESGKTFVESADLGARPMVYVLADGDVIWFSERDGWGSLYLYDGKTGALKRRLTSTGWTVRNVLRLDEVHGGIYVAGNEREPGVDPYYRIVYRVGLHDGSLKRLTPEDADHSVRAAQMSVAPDEAGSPGGSAEDLRGFSPTGHYFVETIMRTDVPSRTVLRAADGRQIVEIERADINRLTALNITPPERFTALAADGKTTLYGTIFRPGDFDPSRHYPIIDSPYPGPQSARTRVGFEANVFDRFGAEAMAELGFIVFTVDGRGSFGRNKAFHDESYGGLGQAGHLDDHVAVIQQLAQRYPYIDANRVGIYGISGGGYATAHALFTYPDVFKVGVADAGNHDQRGYLEVWGETYNGPEVGTNYTDAANPLLAKNLRGKLLLMHGDMDINVSPSLTLQVVDALIKANKDFDLLIVPNGGHGTMWPYTYAMRRTWDYFIRNLQGAIPPTEYDFAPARKALKEQM